VKSKKGDCFNLTFHRFINKKGTPEQVPFFKMPASSFGLTEHALHHFIPEHWHIQGFGH
jgi:hypothetical protein